MKQEFITLYGKVVFANNILFIQNFYFKISERLIGKLIFSIVPWIVLLTILFKGLDDPKSKTELVIWSVLCLLSLIYSYELLFLESYSKRIAIDKISYFESKQDQAGYITFVILKLRSGRKRIIPFRTSEAQHEGVIQFLQIQGVPAGVEAVLK